MTYLTERNHARIVEVPITFRDRSLGRSKMSGRIVVEALLLVTRWGVGDRISGRGARPVVGAAAR
jgi:dolichol-phosphate mannosyltransferase